MSYATNNLLQSLDKKPVPQFYDPANDVNDPLTGASLGNGHYGSDNIMWGKTTGGVYVPLQVDANGIVQIAGNVSLAGSNLPPLITTGYVTFSGENSVSIRDTSAHFSDWIDWTKGYGAIITVDNQLDQPVNVYFGIADGTFKAATANPGTLAAIDAETGAFLLSGNAATGYGTVANGVIRPFANLPAGGWAFVTLQSTTAPTTGTLTISYGLK